MSNPIESPNWATLVNFAGENGMVVSAKFNKWGLHIAVEDNVVEDAFFTTIKPTNWRGIERDTENYVTELAYFLDSLVTNGFGPSYMFETYLNGLAETENESDSFAVSRYSW